MTGIECSHGCANWGEHREAIARDDAAAARAKVVGVIRHIITFVIVVTCFYGFWALFLTSADSSYGWNGWQVLGLLAAAWVVVAFMAVVGGMVAPKPKKRGEEV